MAMLAVGALVNSEEVLINMQPPSVLIAIFNNYVVVSENELINVSDTLLLYTARANSFYYFIPLCRFQQNTAITESLDRGDINNASNTHPLWKYTVKQKI